MGKSCNVQYNPNELMPSYPRSEYMARCTPPIVFLSCAKCHAEKVFFSHSVFTEHDVIG